MKEDESSHGCGVRFDFEVLPTILATLIKPFGEPLVKFTHVTPKGKQAHAVGSVNWRTLKWFICVQAELLSSFIEDAIVDFHNEGLKVMITELDIDVVPRRSAPDVSKREVGVNDLYANGCPPEVLQRQAEQYAALFAIFKKHADKISRVTFWGLDDGKS